MSEFPRDCAICGRKIWNAEDFYRHIKTGTHRRALESSVRQKKLEDDREAGDIKLAIELASALEGHVLNPGDEVTTREGRAFKVALNGALFEVPVGSIG